MLCAFDCVLIRYLAMLGDHDPSSESKQLDDACSHCCSRDFFNPFSYFVGTYYRKSTFLKHPTVCQDKVLPPRSCSCSSGFACV